MSETLAGFLFVRELFRAGPAFRASAVRSHANQPENCFGQGLHSFNLFAIIELMTERGYLGEFELMLLLTVMHLGDEAYGVPIARELEQQRGKDVSLGSVYAALERLEGKGLIASSLGDPTPERGGKAKRYFRITKDGLRQVHDTRRVLSKMWQSLPELKGERP
jgi:PadR family transcriptional regulator, regulatory protein PadR